MIIEFGKACALAHREDCLLKMDYYEYKQVVKILVQNLQTLSQNNNLKKCFDKIIFISVSYKIPIPIPVPEGYNDENLKKFIINFILGFHNETLKKD